MGLQIVIQPSGGIAWSKNPSVLSFIRRGIITTPGTYAQMLLVIANSSWPVPGNTFTFGWTGTTIPFYFGNSAPTDPLQMTSWTGTFAVNATQTVNDLNRNPTFAASYTAILLSTSGGYAKILISANNKGTLYNITYSETGTWIDSSSAISGATNEVKPSDYALNMLASVMVNKLVEPQSSGQLQLTATGVLDEPNDRMQLDFYDLKEIGRAMLQMLLPFSAWKPILQPMAIAYAQVILSEFYSGQSWKSEVDTYGDINGYLPLSILNGGIALTNYPPNVSSSYAGGSTLDFLTSVPRTPGQVIDLNEPLWLSICLQPGSYNAVFTVYYSDGTTGTKDMAIDVPLLSSVWTIPTGWIQANLGAVESSKVASYYTAQIWPSGFSIHPTSELFTYIIDTRYFRKVRYFIVQNSLGGWDTVRTVGNNQLSSKISRTITNSAEDINTRASDGTMQMIVNEEEQTWTMRSGWLMSKQLAEYYRELLLSTYVAEILTPLIPASGGAVFKQIFRSLIIEPTSMVFFEDTDSKWSIEWKMMYATREINYSALAPVSEPYFDSIIEITVAESEANEIAMSWTAGNVQVTVNGVVTALSGGNLPLNGSIENHIIITAESLTALSLGVVSGFNAMEINRIASATLSSLTISDFIITNSDYLIDRLTTLYSMQSLTIDCAGAFSPDACLVAALQLYQGGLYSLTSLSLPSSTPTAIGYAAKSTLVAAGITVNTL